MDTAVASKAIVLVHSVDKGQGTDLDLEGLRPIPIRWIDHLSDLVNDLSSSNPVAVVVHANHDHIAAFRACYAVKQASLAPLHLVSARLSEPEIELAKSLGVSAVHHPELAMLAISESVWRFIACGDLPKTNDELRISMGGFELDLSKRILRINGKIVPLTRTEFDLLLTLVESAGTVVSRANLVGNVWGKNWFGVENVLDTHLTHLRRKIGVFGSYRSIVNVRGVGFYFEPNNIG